MEMEIKANKDEIYQLKIDLQDADDSNEALVRENGEMKEKMEEIKAKYKKCNEKYAKWKGKFGDLDEDNSNLQNKILKLEEIIKRFENNDGGNGAVYSPTSPNYSQNGSEESMMEAPKLKDEKRISPKVNRYMEEQSRDGIMDDFDESMKSLNLEPENETKTKKKSTKSKKSKSKKSSGRGKYYDEMEPSSEEFSIGNGNGNNNSNKAKRSMFSLSLHQI